jgi:hypothetical protein
MMIGKGGGFKWSHLDFFVSGRAILLQVFLFLYLVYK